MLTFVRMAAVAFTLDAVLDKNVLVIEINPPSFLWSAAFAKSYSSISLATFQRKSTALRGMGGLHSTDVQKHSGSLSSL